MKKPFLIILILFVITIGLAIVRTFISNNIVTSGIVLSSIESKTQELETQNAILSEKLYKLTSLSEIAKKAEKLGFFENRNNFAIFSQRPVALKQ
ncbi:MAG: hypothetical protein A2798_02085 [Candidatus Levybacteria bacterium RIFCSPHIGHO2_01_FULL_37_17]|nr:MAG: hypothetical protein A2798_02085 [Candidatus Levybacteria bacterium RIFCSPHIGHO2_01_FULL_37_17]OGH36668.1 MAG: hypothetical protein A2959_00075 [Candidatus Levybacteria bacterium RIFCSPLOWO2_01_FULL_38_23]